MQTMAAQYHAATYTDDVKNCFLFSDVAPGERLYIILPPHLQQRCPDTGEELLWITLRAIYGMIIAARCWQIRFTRFALMESRALGWHLPFSSSLPDTHPSRMLENTSIKRMSRHTTLHLSRCYSAPPVL